MAGGKMDMSNPKYEYIKDLGSGNFGIAKLMRDKTNGELVAVKFIDLGDKIDKNVERELINHHQLVHPNIVRFKEAYLTNTHLGIVMEYASGGELFDQVVRAGRFSEDLARFFFQQLICGVAYCHSKGVVHRDVKLENTLLDGSPAPRVKICDFGYSKSEKYNSQPNTKVGTPAYTAPEVLSTRVYDGKSADVWSCGVMLYVMLVGAYPFEDPADRNNFQKTVKRILAVQYGFPSSLHLSRGCLDLMHRIFCKDPTQRINIQGIKAHPWYQINLPHELRDGGHLVQQRMAPAVQTVDDLRAVITEARRRGRGQVHPAQAMAPGGGVRGGPAGHQEDPDQQVENYILQEEYAMYAQAAR